MGIKALVVGAGAVCAAICLAPGAHADYTWTVQQICDNKSPGTVAMPIIGSPDITCAQPGSTPGLFIAAPMSIPRIMGEFRPGSYSTDPANVWADWIVPAGSQPKPAPKIASPGNIGCDRINGVVVCSPDIPVGPK
ncbi:hypothetical protein [Mycolicibacterium sp.]|uniref:hypothetical protein n=1 Tax=Mycolicibacterium sp. TaxID=2320850 RepID=UPI0037CBE7DD